VPCQHDATAMNGNRMCSAEYPCGEDGCADVVIWDGWTVRRKREKRERERKSPSHARAAARKARRLGIPAPKTNTHFRRRIGSNHVVSMASRPHAHVALR
jgi:hypothetical protein